MNLPNSITVLRILAVPLLMWLLNEPPTTAGGYDRALLAAALFLLVSLLAVLDSQLAKRLQQVTALGTLLHPLAGELLIAGSFISLVRFSPILVPAWVATAVVGREFLVTGLRSIAAQQGFSFHTSDLGRLKLTLQTFAVPAVLLATGHEAIRIPLAGISLAWVAHAAVWLTMALSLYSAGDYFYAFWRVAGQKMALGERRGAFVLRRRGKPSPVPESCDPHVSH